MSTRIPPLLEPYLLLPRETSLTLLTSVLGASTNWLVVRYLSSFLAPSPTAVSPSLPSTPSASSPSNVSVLLVSFLRDYPFFRDLSLKQGLDLDSAGRKGRFGYVDGLSSLYLPAPPPPAGTDKQALARPWVSNLTSARVDDVRSKLLGAVEGLKRTAGTHERRVALVIDGLDTLLATASDEEGIGQRVQDLLLDLREQTHATILTLSADAPLFSSQTTRLEEEHAALILSGAHAADVVLSLRLLDTGTAKDVSGVIRVTRGGGGGGADGETDGEMIGVQMEDREYLYHVLGDGGVRVFERGQ
ncbi:hypothetical protein GE09DRAFT_1188309 [Coniochaeta sp. 2T2.1]|nr:hypothetical protein GE09DRAFT_1188309 [Coniochaeta sp. 2T2.1]